MLKLQVTILLQMFTNDTKINVEAETNTDLFKCEQHPNKTHISLHFEIIIEILHNKDGQIG